MAVVTHPGVVNVVFGMVPVREDVAVAPSLLPVVSVDGGSRFDSESGIFQVSSFIRPVCRVAQVDWKRLSFKYG